MIRRVRFAYKNLIGGVGSTLTASSQQPALPAVWVYDQLRSQRWRSKLGYNVVAGFNDRLDFTEGGISRTADLTPGNYPTPSLYAALITARMNAQAGVVNAYTASYSSATKTFTLSRGSGAAPWSVPWATGPNADRSCGKDLGFDITTDDDGLVAYAADLPSYHSREWLKVDLGSPQEIAFTCALDHNAGVGGVFTLQSSDADDWSGPGVISRVLAGDTEKRLAYVAPQNARFLRLGVDDVQNPAGFSELGVWWAGCYFEPSRSVDIRFKDAREELSRVVQADQGAHFQIRRARRRALEVRFSWLLRPDRDSFEAMAEHARVGGNVFFGLDVDNAPATALYGFFVDPLSADFELTADDRYGIPVRFLEALG